MAAVTATNVVAHTFSTPAGPKTSTQSPAGSLRTCLVACNFTGTYATGTGFSLTSAQIAAAISGELRDGGTITIWDVASAAPGQEGAGNTWTMPGQVTFASSAGPATGLLYGSDMATEHAAAVMGTMASPCLFSVTFLDGAAL